MSVKIQGDVRRLVKRRQGGESLAQIMEVDEELLQALESQAYQLYTQGQREKAEVIARGIVALEEDRAVPRLILGDLALQDFRFTEATEHLERAHQLAPEERGIRARFAEALLKAGRKADARRHFQAIVEAPGDLEEAQLRRSEILLARL